MSKLNDILNSENSDLDPEPDVEENPSRSRERIFNAAAIEITRHRQDVVDAVNKALIKENFLDELARQYDPEEKRGRYERVKTEDGKTTRGKELKGREIHVPVNGFEDQLIRRLAKKKGVTVAALLRNLVLEEAYKLV